MILRKHHQTEFTIIGNELLQKSGLPFKVLGLLCYLLSLPENWKVLGERIARANNDGRDSVFKIMNMLEELGYIKRHYIQQGGEPIHVCDVTEVPHKFNRDNDVSRIPEKPHSKESGNIERNKGTLERNKKESTLEPLGRDTRNPQETAFSISSIEKPKAKKNDTPHHQNPKYKRHFEIALAAVEQMGKSILPSNPILADLARVIDDCTVEWTLEQQAAALPMFITQMQTKGVLKTPGHLVNMLSFKGRGGNLPAQHPIGQVIASVREERDNKPQETAPVDDPAVGMSLAEFVKTEEGQKVKAFMKGFGKRTSAGKGKTPLKEIEEVMPSDEDHNLAEEKKHLIKQQLQILQSQGVA